MGKIDATRDNVIDIENLISQLNFLLSVFGLSTMLCDHKNEIVKGSKLDNCTT